MPPVSELACARGIEFPLMSIIGGGKKAPLADFVAAERRSAAISECKLAISASFCSSVAFFQASRSRVAAPAFIAAAFAQKAQRPDELNCATSKPPGMRANNK